MRYATLIHPSNGLRVSITIGAGGLLLLLACAETARAATIVADDADDVCAPTADPCVITDTVQIVHRSVLDFGTRTLELKNGGQLDFGWGKSTVFCGGLTATLGTKPGIRLEAAGAGATATIVVSRRCSGDTTIICENDATCADADAGTCSVGSGDVWMDAKVDGNASWPALLWIQAAGGVTFLKTVKIAASSSTSDGGELVVEAYDGSITVANNVTASGGSDAEGGFVVLAASEDVVVTNPIDVTGGYGDGGTIELIAGRDVQVSHDLSADSTSKDGFGGSIYLDAGRDISITGGSSSNRVILSADGHNSSLEGIGGDGGELVLLAGRDVTIGQYGRLQADGAIPDGFGGYVELEAGDTASLAGEIFARAKGSDGVAGLVGLSAGSTVSFMATSKVDMTGGEAILVGAADDLVEVNGLVDVSGSGTSLRGAVFFDSGGDLSISGSILNDGIGSSFIGIDSELTGCWVTLTSTALVDTRGAESRNDLVSREQTIISSGAQLLADGATGKNEIAYRSSAKPPVLNGTVTPSAVLSLEPSLAPCPVCGNGDLELGETCDDGNVTAGDGCGSLCQDEGCQADTPGYPSVALCHDGDPCTLDSCDAAAHQCVHAFPCDDEIGCTIDTCTNGLCFHEADDDLCDDSNVCTIDLCNLAVDCQHVSEEEGTVCDDGLYCNGSDGCSDGECLLHAGDPCAGGAECNDYCNEADDNCLAPTTVVCSSDGNACTDDHCNGAGSCIHTDNAAPCDDGVFCNGADTCSGGTCDVHAGSPCPDLGECFETCDEDADQCLLVPIPTCP